MELWHPIRGFPNYRVSSEGQVMNTTTDRILKSELVKGYPRVVLCNRSVNKPVTVHRLVADTFYDGDHTGLQVNHIDGCKTNNFVGNLEWVSCGDNLRHAYRTGLKRPPCPNPRKVKIVETDQIFSTMSECARAINGSKAHIGECLAGKRKSHMGYHFEDVG